MRYAGFELQNMKHILNHLMMNFIIQSLLAIMKEEQDKKVLRVIEQFEIKLTQPRNADPQSLAVFVTDPGFFFSGVICTSANYTVYFLIIIIKLIKNLN